MDRDLRIRQQKHLKEEFTRLYQDGCRRFDFMGGRRSGKTYFILQRLLGLMGKGKVVSVATMTDTQGRLGAYQDAIDILVESPTFAPDVRVVNNVRELRHSSGGRMFFKSYQSSERAKGIACDWLYINEGNNFTEQQYIDLAASVREGVIVDRNPNTECWTERNGFSLIHSTWRDNADHLTEAQKQWFADLKAKAESPNATSADVAFYKMYYLGEYAEILGEIFTPANIVRETIDPKRLRNFAIVADPSGLTGADYFASVLVATDGARLYIIDALSMNESTIPSTIAASNWDEWCKRWQPVLDIWREWIIRYNVRMIFAESNGVGAEFLRYARSQGLSVKPFTAKGNKHTRILNNYSQITARVVWNTTETMDAYLRQVFEYAGKDTDKHDDNIDCANSAFDIFYKETRLMQ